MTQRYARFETLRFSRPEDGVLEVVISGPAKFNPMTPDMHRDLAEVWVEVDRDPDTRVAVVRGEGEGFSAGGEHDLLQQLADDFEVRASMVREARALVYNIVDCSKPIVSAMHGVAVGAGLAVGLLADVSIAARSLRILDGHTRLGVAAGDHAVLIWPLLVSLAKAKYYLFTNEPLSGEEAERIGLVALCVDDEQLLDTAFDVARRLAAGSQTAIRWTKYALNTWLHRAGPSFETSLALESLGFSGPDVQEGITALRERRDPDFRAGSSPRSSGDGGPSGGG